MAIEAGESIGDEGILHLVGTFEKGYDNKHRIIIPEEMMEYFRQSQTGNRLRIYVGYAKEDGIPYAVLRAEFKDESGLEFSRYRAMGVDAQNRVGIPDESFKQGELEQKVWLLGCGDHARIYGNRNYRRAGEKQSLAR